MYYSTVEQFIDYWSYVCENDINNPVSQMLSFTVIACTVIKFACHPSKGSSSSSVK